MVKDGSAQPLTNESKEAFTNAVMKYAKKGLRTLAIAVKFDLG